MSCILVVDDEPAIGWSLREMLAEEGHEVVVAANAGDAVAAAARARPTRSCSTCGCQAATGSMRSPIYGAWWPPRRSSS